MPTLDLAFPTAPLVTLPIEGTAQRAPVHRIYCVGRNYAEHAREMGFDPDREPPFFFQKNPDALIDCAAAAEAAFPYPSASKDVHHEIELVAVLGSGGRDIPVASALQRVFGYAVGLDMTRRDLQGVAKKMGRPWEVGKAFDHSAPCSAVAPVSRIGHVPKAKIWLDVNGVRRQTGEVADMIWKLPEIISTLSTLWELKAGDVVFTGTPEGVGPVVEGDVMEGGVEGVGTIKVRVG
jgi:fumarylpyruvate hydrolase